ncbi:MAG TPA: alpha/beta hydrolase, partial [Methylomirabilota bacterium]
GIHVNLLSLRRDIKPPAQPSAEEKQYLDDLAKWQREETGYQWIQGTRPQTLAFGLSDSPAGLAAWIVEKFRAWSDCGGDVERRFTKDELLTNVMIYWVTGSINASFWPYYARFHTPWPIADGQRIEVPTGYAAFPKEIVRPPRAWAERMYNITRWTDMPAGGHFAAMEEPAALAADLRAFFREYR